MKDLISIAAYSGKGIGAMVHCRDFLVSILNHIPVSYTHLDVYKRQKAGRAAYGGDPAVP